MSIQVLHDLQIELFDINLSCTFQDAWNNLYDETEAMGVANRPFEHDLPNQKQYDIYQVYML